MVSQRRRSAQVAESMLTLFGYGTAFSFGNQSFSTFIRFCPASCQLFATMWEAESALGAPKLPASPLERKLCRTISILLTKPVGGKQ